MNKENQATLARLAEVIKAYRENPEAGKEALTVDLDALEAKIQAAREAFPPVTPPNRKEKRAAATRARRAK